MSSSPQSDKQAPTGLRDEILSQLETLQMSEEEILLLPPQERALVQEIIDVQGQLVKNYKGQGFDTYVPMDHQLPAHSSQASTRAFIGANKMGKSRWLHQEVKWYALGNHPYREVSPRGPIWICAQSDEKSESYQQPQLERILGSEHIRKKIRSPRTKWQLTNDQWIYFKNYSQDVATFASDEIRLIGYDEEPPYDIWEEGWMRRSADYPLDIILTCTPTNGLTWIWNKIIDRTEGNKELLPDTEWFGGSIHQNTYLSDEQKELVASGLSGVMYRIRIMGEILPIGGSMVFPADVLSEWRLQSSAPILQMDLKLDAHSGARWVQDTEGPLWLWELPKEGHEYLIGCDPAEGLNTSHSDAEPDHDQTSIAIFDRHTRKYVGEYTSGKIRPDEVGEWILPTLSTWFNGARTIIERNNHGHAVIALARKKMLGRLYRPMQDRTDVALHSDEGYGYLSTKPSKNYAIDMMHKAIAQRSVQVFSQPTIRQFLTFVLKSNGRREHQDGAKDDRVISHALCQVFDNDISPVLKIADRSIKAELRRLAGVKQQPRRGDWFKRYH